MKNRRGSLKELFAGGTSNGGPKSNKEGNQLAVKLGKDLYTAEGVKGSKGRAKKSLQRSSCKKTTAHNVSHIKPELFGSSYEKGVWGREKKELCVVHSSGKHDTAAQAKKLTVLHEELIERGVRPRKSHGEEKKEPGRQRGTFGHRNYNTQGKGSDKATYRKRGEQDYQLEGSSMQLVLKLGGGRRYDYGRKKKKDFTRTVVLHREGGDPLWGDSQRDVNLSGGIGAGPKFLTRKKKKKTKKKKKKRKKKKKGRVGGREGVRGGWGGGVGVEVAHYN